MDAMLFTVFALALGLVGLAMTIWILIYAFQDSILWGLGCIFIPFVIFVYCILNWENCKKPFFISVLTMVLFIPLFMWAYQLEMKTRAANAPPPLPIYDEK